MDGDRISSCLVPRLRGMASVSPAAVLILVNDSDRVLRIAYPNLSKLQWERTFSIAQCSTESKAFAKSTNKQ